jgi:homoserine O-acetyltransferase
VRRPFPAAAADYPAPKEGVWVAKDFRFHTGRCCQEVKLGYRTIGSPTGEPVVVLTAPRARARPCSRPASRASSSAAGQPLDASRYYVILPRLRGPGRSSKPSDGLRTKFPRYNYDDMVEAHHRLLTEGLGVSTLRL